MAKKASSSRVGSAEGAKKINLVFTRDELRQIATGKALRQSGVVMASNNYYTDYGDRGTNYCNCDK